MFSWLLLRQSIFSHLRNAIKQASLSLLPLQYANLGLDFRVKKHKYWHIADYGQKGESQL